MNTEHPDENVHKGSHHSRLRRLFSTLKLRIKPVTKRLNAVYKQLSGQWHQLDTRYGWRWRVANGLAALLIIFTVIVPVLSHIIDGRAYKLSNATLSLIGPQSSGLSSKLQYNAKTKAYEFNKQAITTDANPVAALSKLKSQIGGESKDSKNLYSLDVHQDIKKGVTYYDTNSQLSFDLVPKFGGLKGQVEDGRLVYPLRHKTQAIYTLKGNGLKEDIVVQKASDDTMTFSYTLKLPKTLEVRAIEDGSGNIGIYSASPSLYSNMSYGSDKDKALVQKARENGTKDTLVFGLPKPTITVSKGDDASNVSARFELKGNSLNVVAEGLDSLKKPFSIDPSVVITSASDFSLDANNEGNIEFGVSDDIKRGGLSGGTTSAWATQTAPPAPGTCNYSSSNNGSGIHNGYIYTMAQDAICWAKLNSNGTVNGSWTATTGFTRVGYTGVVYNGYIYIIGGNSPNDDTTAYAKLNTDGSIGSFTAGTNLSVSGYGSQLRALAYNGYIYTLGGANGLFAQSTRVEKAQVNPNGSLGSWTTSGVTAMPVGTNQQMVAAYNGYMYIAGGNGTPTNVYYAPIASNGDVGAWITGTPLPSDGLNSRISGSVIYRGYWYLIGGLNNGVTNQATVRYAQINANGSIGSWLFTNSLPNPGFTVAQVYNNYLFAVTNGGGTNYSASASIDAAGVLQPGTWQTGTSVASAASSYGRMGTVYNGYMYFAGGVKVAAGLTEVQYAPITSTGALGAWTATTSMGTGRLSGGLVAYDGWLYVASGCTSASVVGGCTAYTATTEYARICDGVITTDGCSGLANGAVGTWNAGPSLATGSSSLFGMVAYKGYLYTAGGTGGTGTGATEYSQINSSTHIPGAWATAGSSLGTMSASMAVYNDQLYLVKLTNGADGKAWAAPVNSGGSAIGNWDDSAAADLSAGTGNNQTSSLLAAKGYLYVTNYTDASTSTKYAQIQSNGNVGSWGATTSMAAPGASHAAATDGNAIYVINTAGTTQYQFINNGGSGITGASVANGTAGAVFGKYWTGGAAYGNYAYSVAGCNNPPLISGTALSCGNTAMNAETVITPVCDGTLGAGVGCTAGTANTLGTNADAGQNITDDRFGLASVAYNGYLYAIGGCGATNSSGSMTVCTAAGFKGDVQYTAIGNNGSLVGWQTDATTFNAPRYGHAAAVYNGYLYIFGGCSAATVGSGGCTTYTDEINYGLLCNSINITVASSDCFGANAGEVGTWHNVTPSGFTKRMYFGGAAYNGYLYAIAGCTTLASGSCSVSTNSVQSLQLSSTTGAPTGNWTSQQPSGAPRWGVAAVAYNGYLYVSGGCQNTADTCQSSTTPAFSAIYVAPIGTGGSLGSWQLSPNTFQPASIPAEVDNPVVYGHTLAVAAGNIVSLRGVTGTNTYSQRARIHPLVTIPRKALYSKLFAFPFNMNLRQITYTGSLTNGLADVTYKLGPSSGTSWGSTLSPSSLANLRCPDTGVGGTANNKYLQLMVNFDDTQRGTFPDYSADASNVTDLTLSYEFARPPQQRLRLGKTLIDKYGQSDLDICKLKT